MIENTVISKINEYSKKEHLDKLKADKVKALKEGKIITK